MEREAPDVTEPTNWLVLPLVTAPQLRVLDWPAVMVLGLAVKEEITGAPGHPGGDVGVGTVGSVGVGSAGG